MTVNQIELRLRKTRLRAGGAVRRGWRGGTAGLKVASAVNNSFRGNIQRPLLGALSAMASNYSPRPPVIIRITSRTEESVTQHAGQGEGKATEHRINISFTHPAFAILGPGSNSPMGGREGGREHQDGGMEMERKKRG